MRRLLTALALLSAGVALAGGGNVPKVGGSFQEQLDSCDPVPSQVVRAAQPDAFASKRVADLFKADQAAREGPVSKIDWEKLVPQDRARRLEVARLIQARRLYNGEDFIGAAFIFQHGNCTAHYQLTRQLAQQAMRLNTPGANWIYAAATDRRLRSLNLPQKYGTQFMCIGGSDVGELQAYDPATTDAERAEYGVPPLAESLEQAKTICK
jgi:hypothetical protein